MASAGTVKTLTLLEGARTDQPETCEVYLRGPHELACYRCGGLMVDAYCMDLRNSTGELECVAKRCVQCGEIVDPVILRNRGLQNKSTSVRPQAALGLQQYG